MPKHKPVKMWALWNYNHLMGVEATRRQARAYANALVIGGKPEADKMFRSKSFRISKCAVREI